MLITRNNTNNGAGGQRRSGFTALISVILLSSGTLAMSLSALAVVVMYSDSVFRHELRIQNGLNELACNDAVRIMMAKDVFLKGTVTLPEFGCVREI